MGGLKTGRLSGKPRYSRQIFKIILRIHITKYFKISLFYKQGNYDSESLILTSQDSFSSLCSSLANVSQNISALCKVR